MSGIKYELIVATEGVVTSTNGEPVPENTSTEEQQ